MVRFKYINAESMVKTLKDRMDILVPLLGFTIFALDMAGTVGAVRIEELDWSLPYFLSLISLATSIYTVISLFKSGYLVSYSVSSLLIFILASPILFSIIYSFSCGYFPEDSLACFISIKLSGNVESTYLPLFIVVGLLIVAAEMTVLGMVVELIDALLRIFLRKSVPYKGDNTRGYISSLYVVSKYIGMMETVFPGAVSLIASMVMEKPEIKAVTMEIGLTKDHIKALLGISRPKEEHEESSYGGANNCGSNGCTDPIIKGPFDLSPAEYIDRYRRVAREIAGHFLRNKGEELESEEVICLIASGLYSGLVKESFKNLVLLILFTSFLTNSFYFLSATSDTGLFSGVIGIVGMKLRERDSRKAEVLETQVMSSKSVECMKIETIEQFKHLMGALAGRVSTLLLILYFLYIAPTFMAFLGDIIRYGGRYLPMGFEALSLSLSIIPVWITSLWGLMMYKLESRPLDPGILPKPRYMLALASMPSTLVVSTIPMVISRDNVNLGIVVSSILIVVLLSLLIGVSIELFNLGAEGIWEFHRYIEGLPFIGKIERERRLISNFIAFLVWTLCLEASLLFPMITLIISL